MGRLEDNPDTDTRKTIDRFATMKVLVVGLFDTGTVALGFENLV